jgi:hypothetical protein
LSLSAYAECPVEMGGSSPLKPLHLARKPAFHRQRTFLHLFCDGDDAGAFFRQYEPVDRALKQHLTGLLFERFQPSAHGGLAELQGSCGAGQSACPPAFAAAPIQKVQSGYLHVMVGKFEITAISDGTVDWPVDKLLAQPAEETKAALSRSFLSEPTETSVNAYLINTGEKLILVDTGAGQLFGPTLRKLAANIRAAGYQLDQIDDIVLTHLHPDHVGGSMADGKMVFPKATIHADKADTDYWLSSAEQKRDGDASGFSLAPWHSSIRTSNPIN